ncbi:hypothetical protein Tco_0553601 [Tanacetum coccineum]
MNNLLIVKELPVESIHHPMLTLNASNIVNEYNIVENSHDHVRNSPGKMENSPCHVENSLEQLENSPGHVKNSPEQIENEFDHMENSSVHVENSPKLSEDPFGNEAMENVAHEGVSSPGTIESEPKNMSPGGSKHDHVDSLAPSPKPINGFSILERFQEFISIGQPMAFSMRDHNSILLRGQINMRESHMDYGPTPFRLFHSWFLEQDSTSVVEDSRNNDVVRASNAMILLKNKLKSLKQTLKTCIIQNKSIMDHSRRVLLDCLLEIDLCLDKGEGIHDDLPNHAKIFHDTGVIDHKIYVDRAQKAKKRRQQATKGILLYGEWIDNPDRIKREFYNHFVKKFSTPDWPRVPIEGIFPQRLGDDSSHDLERDIYDDEIKKATFDGTLILNEIVSWCKSRKDQALLFKVNFQKAFDSVKWDPLDDILGVVVAASGAGLVEAGGVGGEPPTNVNGGWAHLFCEIWVSNGAWAIQIVKLLDINTPWRKLKKE